MKQLKNIRNIFLLLTALNLGGCVAYQAPANTQQGIEQNDDYGNLKYQAGYSFDQKGRAVFELAEIRSDDKGEYNSEEITVYFKAVAPEEMESHVTFLDKLQQDFLANGFGVFKAPQVKDKIEGVWNKNYNPMTRTGGYNPDRVGLYR